MRNEIGSVGRLRSLRSLGKLGKAPIIPIIPIIPINNPATNSSRYALNSTREQYNYSRVLSNSKLIA